MMAEPKQSEQRQQNTSTTSPPTPPSPNAAVGRSRETTGCPLVTGNPVTRTVSDSAAYGRRDARSARSTRSVTFYESHGDRQKRKLQRTPTPYWSRKEVSDLCDSCLDASFDDDDAVTGNGVSAKTKPSLVLSIDEESDDEEVHGNRMSSVQKASSDPESDPDRSRRNSELFSNRLFRRAAAATSSSLDRADSD